MSPSRILFSSLFVTLALVSRACRAPESSPRTPLSHEGHPQTDAELPPEVEAFMKELLSSEYHAYVSSLKPKVVGKRVERSQAGHSGFALFLDDGSWVASYLQNERLEWQAGSGALPGEVESLLSSPEYGDAQRPLPSQDRPYAAEPCDLVEQIGQAHGMKIDALAIGRDCFNFAFEDGHELDTALVTTQDGRLGLRVFWEQW